MSVSVRPPPPPIQLPDASILLGAVMADACGLIFEIFIRSGGAYTYLPLRLASLMPPVPEQGVMLI